MAQPDRTFYYIGSFSMSNQIIEMLTPNRSVRPLLAQTPTVKDMNRAPNGTTTRDLDLNLTDGSVQTLNDAD